MTSPTPLLDAELRARELHDDFEGFTPEQIRSMSASEFARLTGRHFGPGAGVPAPGLDPVLVDYMDATRNDEVEPDGIDPNSPEFFHAWRASRQSGGEGVGIFNQSSGSQSEAYRAAASKQSGRTGWIGSNVEEAPRISRPNLVGVDRPNLDARPLSERFGTDNNAFRYEG